jgi:hypothetical protein
MKNTKSAKNQVVTKTPAEINWNAKYYREKAAMFYNSASYTPPSEPVVIEMNKREKKALVKAGLTAAAKVRHNRPVDQRVITNRTVMVGGVPHKMRDGKLVAMIPAAESKKWDIIEVKPSRKKKK